MTDPLDVPLGEELPADVDAALTTYGSAMYDCGFFPPGPLADGTADRTLRDRAALVSVILRWGGSNAEAARRQALDEAVQMTQKVAEEYSTFWESTSDEEWQRRSATAQVIALRLGAMSSEGQPTGPDEAEHPG